MFELFNSILKFLKFFNNPINILFIFFSHFDSLIGLFVRLGKIFLNFFDLFPNVSWNGVRFAHIVFEILEFLLQIRQNFVLLVIFLFLNYDFLGLLVILNLGFL